MINPDDLHTRYFTFPLTTGGSTYGTATFKYEVRQVVNVQNLKTETCYRVLVTHRVNIPNGTAFNLTPKPITSYDDYPAVLFVDTGFELGHDPELLDYQPRTLNTAIMTSSNASENQSESYSQQHTSGSATSQTNSYDVNVSVGFFGDVPTGSVGASYGHSTTNTKETSDSTGSDHGTSRGRDVGESMSVKDWGSYAILDDARTAPSWVWGQEYPWDVVQYRNCPSGTNAVDVPAFVLNRLFDNPDAPTLVYPPSHLALFGIDFNMKATWQVALKSDVEKQVIRLEHQLQLLTASHGIDGGGAAYVNLSAAPSPFSTTSPALDLTLLGLDAVTGGDGDNGAIIGFSGARFIAPPTPTSTFKILSSANNLQTTGTGFATDMSADFSNPTQLTIQFKVIDDVVQYSLFMKHWKTSAAGCTLSFDINGQTTIERHVDDLEGEGGANNLLVLNLRNKDYSSIDYHDYLVPGLNTITVTITGDSSGAKYQLRALAIGEE